MIMYVLKIKLIIFHLVKYEKRIINNMIFTEKDIIDLKKAKIALNKLGKSSINKRKVIIISNKFKMLDEMIEVIEDMIIELEEYR